MKPKILIIEDDPHDYKELAGTINKDKYDILPWFVDENNNGFNQMKRALNRRNLPEYIKKCIEINYRTIRVIICDLLFDGYDIQGHNIIQYIRNEIEVTGELKLFPKLVPIIAYTNFTNKEFARQAILSGATHNIQKNSKYFNEIIDSACKYFRSSYIDREINLIENYLNQNKKLLIENNKLISSGFGNIELLVKGKHNETIDKFSLLFRVVFASLDTDQKKRLFDIFKNDLEHELTDDEISKISTTSWEKIKMELQEMNKGGGFKAFVDATYEILNHAGLLDTKAKIIGSGIKGVFSILSS